MQGNEHFSSRSDEKCESVNPAHSHFSSLRDEKCSFLCISRRSLRSLLEMRKRRLALRSSAVAPADVRAIAFFSVPERPFTADMKSLSAPAHASSSFGYQPVRS